MIKFISTILLFTVLSPIFCLTNPFEGFSNNFDIADDFIWGTIDLSSYQFVKGSIHDNETVKNGFSIGYEGIISLDENQTSTQGLGVELVYPNSLEDGNIDEQFYFLPIYFCFQWHPFNRVIKSDLSPYLMPRIGLNVNPGGRIYYGLGIGLLVNSENPWRIELKYDEYWGRESYSSFGGNVDIRHKRLSLMIAYAFD